MYESVLLLPLNKEKLQQDVVYNNGTRTTLTLPASDYDLIKTYHRVGIFDFLDTETGKMCFRPDTFAVESGKMRRATQYEYDKWAHDFVTERFSGNALVFSTHLSSDSHPNPAPKVAQR